VEGDGRTPSSLKKAGPEKLTFEENERGMTTSIPAILLYGMGQTITPLSSLRTIKKHSSLRRTSKREGWPPPLLLTILPSVDRGDYHLRYSYNFCEKDK
jgi:hypothetical protein